MIVEVQYWRPTAQQLCRLPSPTDSPFGLGRRNFEYAFSIGSRTQRKLLGELPVHAALASSALPTTRPVDICAVFELHFLLSNVLARERPAPAREARPLALLMTP